MRISAVIAPVLLTLLTGGALAQDGDDDTGISGKAALGYLATSGNTDSTNTNAAFNLLYQQPVWGHEFTLSAVSATRDDVTTAESYSAIYDARRAFGERSYLFTALDWRRDEFSAFDRQMSETVGYGHRLVVSDRHDLSVEGGLGARQTTRRSGIKQDDQIARAALDYELTVNDSSRFTQSLTAESGSTNTSFESLSEFRARLFGDVALVLSHRIRHNSDVEPGSEDTDRFTSIALEYAW